MLRKAKYMLSYCKYDKVYLWDTGGQCFFRFQEHKKSEYNRDTNSIYTRYFTKEGHRFVD